MDSREVAAQLRTRCGTWGVIAEEDLGDTQLSALTRFVNEAARIRSGRREGFTAGQFDAVVACTGLFTRGVQLVAQARVEPVEVVPWDGSFEVVPLDDGALRAVSVPRPIPLVLPWVPPGYLPDRFAVFLVDSCEGVEWASAASREELVDPAEYVIPLGHGLDSRDVVEIVRHANLILEGNEPDDFLSSPNVRYAIEILTGGDKRWMS